MLPTIATGNVGSALAGGYEVANSLRFDGSNDYLNITSGSSPTNTKKFTVSFWLKRSELGREQHIFGGVSAAQCYFISDDRLRFADTTSGTNYYTTQKFRDVSAWYHIVIAVDTTLGTAGDRARIYVNGSEITAFDTETNATQNNNTAYNIGSTTYVIGRYNPSQAQNYYYSGYMAEYVFIDGQQLDPTSFGEFDEDSGIWKPIDVSGLTFGTNGFYLDFEDSSALGNDAAGSNNFTVNNLTAIDQTTDTCTNNFATLNPLNTSTNITMAEGNTKITTSTNGWMGSAGTIGITKGFPCYWEAKATTNTRIYFGLSRLEDYDPVTGTTTEGQSNLDYMWRASSANLVYYRGSSQSVTVSAVSAGDILACSVDSSGNVKFYNNGSAIHTFSTVLVDGYFYFPILSVNGYTSTETMEANFGNPAFSISSGNTDANGYGNFEHAPPANHYALNTKNLAEYG